MQEFTYPVDSAKSKLIRKKHDVYPFMRYDAVVQTYTVHPTNTAGKILRGGPDDNTLKDPELAELVRRGCSDLFIKGDLVAQVRGPAKFFGSDEHVDEDDLPFEGADEKDFSVFDSVQSITNAKIDQWNTDGVLRTDFWNKENGKFAIATLFIQDGKVCIFGGSKNVHVPLELDDDLINLPSDLHYRILRSIIEDLRKCDDNTLRSLVGRQIVGEYCDGKHIVYTEHPYMVYFDESLPANFRKPVKILPSINGKPDSDTLNKLRKLTQIEGVVLYYTNTNTGEIIRRKHKTIWYVTIRCWREIIRKYKKGEISTDSLVNLLISRTQSRSGQFLNLTSEELASCNETATVFIDRLTKSKYAYADVNPFSDVGMAKIWYELMLCTDYAEPENPKQPTEVKETSIFDMLVNPVYLLSVNAAAKIYDVLVIMQGPPGSGKSTVAADLKGYMESEGFSAEIFSTDDYFMKDGIYQFNPKLLGINHAKNLAAASSSKARVVIIDNTNLTPGEYAKYKANMLNRIVIVISCKVDCVEALVRNKHGVPLDVLKKMCAKYTPAAPAYIGGFVPHSDLSEFAGEIKQIQPAHITELFVGGDSRKLRGFEFNTLTHNYPFEITGISRSSAGVGLVCTAAVRSAVITYDIS